MSKPLIDRNIRDVLYLSYPLWMTASQINESLMLLREERTIRKSSYLVPTRQELIGRLTHVFRDKIVIRKEKVAGRLLNHYRLSLAEVRRLDEHWHPHYL